MRNNQLSISSLSARIATLTADVKEVIYAEIGEKYDERSIESAMNECIAGKIETLEENLGEMFTSPARNEFQQLLFLLQQDALTERVEAVEEAMGLAEEYGDDGVFTGNRTFSTPRMAAMMEYLTSKGQFVYKTGLNKLLFYSDLTSFYLRGIGISGAMYHNRRFGPVADPAAPILSELINEGKINVEPRTHSLEAVSIPETDVLSDDDRKILDWVAATYGPMGASALSEFSHNEMAYKNTSPNEAIAYAYAQFFKYLPPKNLLS